MTDGVQFLTWELSNRQNQLTEEARVIDEPVRLGESVLLVRELQSAQHSVSEKT